MSRIALLLLIGVCLAATAGTLWAQHDWPMAGHDAARTGCGSQTLHPPYRPAWTRKLGDGPFGARINEDVQVVSVGDLAYVGAENGEFHALRVADGTTAWMRKLPSVISNAACVTDGLAVVGCADGVAYAFDAESGKPAWQAKTGAGIWSSPCAAEGKVFVTSKDGSAYGIETKTGKILWRAQTGRPIYLSPAYSNGRVFVGSDDMHAYAFDAKTGEQLWKSDKIFGESFRDWWPVVADDVVFFQPQPLQDAEARGFKWPHWAPRGADAETVRQTMVKNIVENRALRQICFALRVADGKEAYVPAVNLNGGANHPSQPVFLLPDGTAGLRSMRTKPERQRRSSICFWDPKTGKFADYPELSGGMQVHDESGGYGSACGWVIMHTQAVWGTAWDVRTGGRGRQGVHGPGWHEGGAGTVNSGQYYQATHSAANSRVFLIYPGVVRCFTASKVEDN